MKKPQADPHSSGPPDWADAPDGWNWLAQDADGRWFWYAVEPRLGYAGGVWRSPRLKQQFARQGQPDPDWHLSCMQRPAGADRQAASSG